jgi:hypothetical protein
MRIVSIALAATLCLACSKREEPAAPPPPPGKPVRGAAADAELRVMLAEIASARACAMMKNSFRGLRAEGRHDVTTGVLWIRDCKITNDGTKVTFHLGGEGWQWTDKAEKKAGAKFEVHDYVKFGVEATIPGALDIGYDTGDHVVSVWFSPSQSPDIKFTAIGDIEVDEKGLWSDILGGFSSVFASSPEEQSKDKADQQGTETFQNELVQGMTVALDLCTGYLRFTTGRAQKGELGPPDPGEAKNRPVEIQRGGLMVFGPYRAPNGMHVTMNTDGPVRAGLACIDDTFDAVSGFIHETEQPLTKTLAQRDIDGSGELAIKGTSCKVALMVRSLAPQKVTFNWQRPLREIAQSTGGPVIHCERKQTVSSDGDGSDRPRGRAAARRR